MMVVVMAGVVMIVVRSDGMGVAVVAVGVVPALGRRHGGGGAPERDGAGDQEADERKEDDEGIHLSPSSR